MSTRHSRKQEAKPAAKHAAVKAKQAMPVFRADDRCDEADSCDSDSNVIAIVQAKKERKEALRSVFDLERVNDPIIGTPAEVQDELDYLALKLQKHPEDEDLFMRIVCYMHKYILGLVFKKYSFVTGSEEKDMYQESLIALHSKAIPGFRMGKGMSFLNFAKLCINRHLITILHASRHRRRDYPLNTAISIDHNPAFPEDDEESSPLSNVIVGRTPPPAPYEHMDRSEVFDMTLNTMKSKLSGFERVVIDEYLDDKSYRDAASSINKRYGERCNEKSIDNALLRIRKKAAELEGEVNEDQLPLIVA
jgi:RNA polymerase sporulation-specific sigma factor